MTKKPTTEDTRAAALSLLKRGIATLSEVAAVAAVSRQLVRYWCVREGLDWQAARDAYLEKRWASALKARAD